MLTRCRDEAVPLRACPQLLQTQGRSHPTLAPCEPLRDAMPSGAVRRACAGSLPYHLATATTRGLDHVGRPISSAPIASFFGVAKQPGGGELTDATRMALRLPALWVCPTFYP